MRPTSDGALGTAVEAVVQSSIAFEFEDTGATLAAQNQFRLDFCQELARLQAWAADLGWRAACVPELRVVVSGHFNISKSLVPAWSGRAGDMEFPAWRVNARKAAILHELAHVFFPNGNRLLAEGLAIYLQAAIGSNSAFPNFGRSLHEVARERLQAMPPGDADKLTLEQLHLADLDAIATPSPLTLRVGPDFYGEDKRGQLFLYAIAGSFVQFLMGTHGMGRFFTLYFQTPLVPLSQSPGAPERWPSVYGVGLPDLESDWKSMIGRRHPQPL